MLYVGVDTHKVNSYLTIVDGAGAIVKQQQVRTCQRAVSQALRDYGEPLSACLEAGYHWGPVYDWLDELCEEVTLVHPAKVRLIGESLIKTDKIDSGILAQLLRADLIPEAYASSTEERKVKRLLRQRLFLVGLRTALKKASIQRLLSQYDLQKPKVTNLFGLKGMEWLCSLQLPGHDNKVLQTDLELLHQLGAHVSRSDNLIADVAAADLAVWWLRSIPGIGKFFSVLIRYEIGRIERFASPINSPHIRG